MRFRFSRLAEADITEIAEHIARGDPNRASSYVRDLRVRCEQLTRFPEAAPLRPAFGESVRASVFGPYLIFYEVRGRAGGPARRAWST